ncbi:TVP38/TMEM64 family protein [Microbaculum sp. FT89]|uniref:TVP38/TMEM64 family protein n=1 Tax=Microbaculum sp. FT89 TaxID=3447298 RepID=UPI003F52EBC5
MTTSERPEGRSEIAAVPREPDDTPRDGTRESAATPWRWLPLALIVAAMAVAVSQGWYRHLTLESLVTHEMALRSFVSGNRAGALAIYAAIYIAVVALSLPGGLLLTLAGGFLFGWLLAGTVTVIAATIGAVIVFLIARSSLGSALAARAGPRLAALQQGFNDDAMHYLLFLRLVPIFPFWLVNIAPALLGVSLSTYVIGTAVGIVPGTFAFAFVGAGLESVLAAQRESFEACVAAATAKNLDPTGACELGIDPSALVTPGLLAALVALGVLALVPIAAKKVLRRRSAG